MINLHPHIAYLYVRESFDPLMLPKCSLKMRSSKCSSFWLATYLLCLVDVLFFKIQSTFPWAPTVLLVDLTKNMCYVYVCAMYVDRAVEKDDICFKKSSAITCKYIYVRFVGKSILQFHLFLCMKYTLFNFAVFYKVVQAIYRLYQSFSIRGSEVPVCSNLDYRIVQSTCNGRCPCIYYDPWYILFLRKIRSLIKTANRFEIFKELL